MDCIQASEFDDFMVFKLLSLIFVFYFQLLVIASLEILFNFKQFFFFQEIHFYEFLLVLTNNFRK